MEIKNAYLIWIGKEHYPTIDAFVKEAEEQGVSKRLPNADVAKSLSEPGTVVFVAHDEGEYNDCDACRGSLANPEKRKARTVLNSARDVLEARGAELEKLRDANEKDEEAIAKAERLFNNATKKVAKLRAAWESLPDTVDGGTGGHVVVDGERWDFVRYNYWLHHESTRETTERKIEKHMCEACGGTGRLPVGRVFGMFLPSKLEYILRPEDNAEIREKMTERGLELVPAAAVKSEPKRGCGYRKPGGVYAVTKPGKSTKDIEAVVKKLVEEGKIKPDGVQIHGDFARFVNEIEIPGVKRFRGIRRWSLDPEAEREAEMIVEAMTG